MDTIVVAVDHLYKSYGSTKAVIDLSFAVEAQRCYAFLGPNGAGKTSALKVLYGKARADRNPDTRVEVFGHDPRRNELKVKTLCGIVPQEDNLDVELNVRQNLLIFSKFYGMSRAQADKRIDYLLEFMELTDKKQSRVRELSGGMKRRLIIARALLNEPPLLIMDEPTTGLDPQVRQLIWDKLRDLMSGGVTVLLSTHYMEEAYQIADTLLIMDKGRKMLEGNPRALLDEHVEPTVLELHNLDQREAFEQRLDGEQVRREESSQRVIYYASSDSALARAADALPKSTYTLRASNLEDLFLRTTGRRLNEQQ